MALSIIARSSIVRQQALARARSLHTTSSLRSDHGHYHHLPFDLPGNNSKKKATFGLKMGLYLAVGFAIPFGASYLQLKKSSGAA
ncbi:uncharacterized protein LACBIDRAFT_311710 [Laccaria bicolor S238N-H82]|uniref:Cytochrome c oxidase subunit 8, mitochondrial n=1 Tax=Laccaria bicolor (strain S238N-H82 / ATCC MYA-4686) TaxID=486041 RepID=B0CY36_LACBS|nr:uncharacterized protein LACBIDRAFT_311710 [Laccaria bicolor S238N-H82]EDR12376.1 predicted protein [Laccaria bicolor S238N-H82]|eukprot:XP_001876640.1 predicted protein [Laccaria bicolor S238N-H82]